MASESDAGHGRLMPCASGWPTVVAVPDGSPSGLRLRADGLGTAGTPSGFGRRFTLYDRLSTRSSRVLKELLVSRGRGPGEEEFVVGQRCQS